MSLRSQQIHSELKKLFSKYYFTEVLLDDYDSKIYDQAIVLFQMDYNRYFPDEIIVLEKIYSRIELIGILLYRISRQFFFADKEVLASHISNLGRLISGFEIYYTAEIGGGLKINHGLGTVIGARTKIGENALIHQNVTLGDKNGERPILLNNVTVYAGAVILGKVICGNNSIIAANCVCIIDVPANAIIKGIPGRIKI